MFDLHPALAADTREITRFPVSRVLVMLDAHYPWLILVPARDGLSGLHDLSDDDRPQVMEEINQASQVLEAIYDPNRINVAALGNMVPQLHIHVIARFEGDTAWPGPVWSAARRKPYTDGHLAETISRLKSALEASSS